MGSVGAVYTCSAARFIVYSLAGTRTVFHIFCCVDNAAAATSLAGIVALILRSLSGTWNLQVGQFGNNCGITTRGDKKIYNTKRL
jgi:hypothetical protein